MSIYDVSPTILVISIAFILFFAFNKYFCFARIVGTSMYPAYKNGEIIIVKKILNPNIYAFEINSTYAFDRGEGTICNIKRLHHFTKRGNLFFLGDNEKDSLDSRIYGAIHPSKVIGKAIKIGGILKWE